MPRRLEPEPGELGIGVDLFLRPERVPVELRLGGGDVPPESGDQSLERGREHLHDIADVSHHSVIVTVGG